MKPAHTPLLCSIIQDGLDPYNKLSGVFVNFSFFNIHKHIVEYDIIGTYSMVISFHYYFIHEYIS